MSEMPKDVVDAVYPAIPPGNELRRPPRRSSEMEVAALVLQEGGEAEARLKSERVELRLKAMPHWRRTLEGKAITRVKELSSPEAATLYSSFVISLAGASNLPVSVNVLNGRVLVTLHARRNRGRFINLTEAVLDLAEKIG
jgi:hypothetical protein